MLAAEARITGRRRRYPVTPRPKPKDPLMATLLAIIAICVALAGLFFATEALKKVDAKNEELIKVHVTEIRKQIGDIKSTLADVEKSVAQAETDLKAAKNHGQALKQIEKDIYEIRDHLVAIDQALPSEKRLRNVVAQRQGG